MSWFETGNAMRVARLGAIFAFAGLAGGCFQPLYGSYSSTGGPIVSEKLQTVQVMPIQAINGTPVARLANEVRNQLIFDLTGGGGTQSSEYQLSINLTSTQQSIIVDTTTARPDVENYGLNASYTMTEIGSGKVAVKGSTFSRVSYDIPGQQQRFARARGRRDAENRAAKVLAEQIRTRLSSYFVTGS